MFVSIHAYERVANLHKPENQPIKKPLSHRHRGGFFLFSRGVGQSFWDDFTDYY